MRILVTGGCGFIGSFLMKEIHIGLPEAEMKNIDAMTYASCDGTRTKAFNAATLIRGDLSQRMQYTNYIHAFNPDYIIHLAAESHVDRAIDDPGVFMQTNIQGTFELLKIARELHEADENSFKKFVYVSTDEVYGPNSSCDGGSKEYDAFNPRNPYSASKAAAEHVVMGYHHTYGLPTVITRGCNTYGPWQTPEKLLPLMILKALRGEDLPVYGDGTQQREWMHAEDHAVGILAAARIGDPGQVYNLSTQESHTNIDIVRAIRSRMNSSSAIRFVEDRPGHDKIYAINPTKANDCLDWIPDWNFIRADGKNDGLAEVIAWYTKKGEVWLDSFDPKRESMERRGTK